MGFQSSVKATPAPAVAGDFASANPRATVLVGPGGLVAGPGGVTVGKFAWVDDDGITVLSHGTATRAPNGFVHREQQALISTYLAESSNIIPEGFPVVLHNAGDFWATLTGANASTIGAALFADYDTGDVTAVAASTGSSVTASMGATMTAVIGATFTASADTDTTRLVVTSVTGLISVGDVVSGTGITAGTTITSQVSGTTGGAGTYQLSAVNSASSATVTSFGTVIKVTAITGYLSVGDTLSSPAGAVVTAQLSGTAGSTGNYTFDIAASAYTASGTITAFGNILDVTAVGSGVLHVGDAVSGSGIPSGAVVASQVSGTTGGVGFYTLDQRATAYAASTTVTGTAGVAISPWKAQSVAAVGELVKISTWG